MLFYLFLAFQISPWSHPVLALLMGLVLALAGAAKALPRHQYWVNLILKSSVVGLGFGISMREALETGQSSFLWTAISIALTLLLGFLLGKGLKIEWHSRFLLSSGTAICGGSAIAALAPLIKAKEQDITMALGTVFLLNALALIAFPPLGSWLGMSQREFGIWAAIAIHDTSSVIGAAAAYGEEALEIATTVKLVRALWIVPLTLIAALWLRKRGKIKFPWFILGFVLAILAGEWAPWPATINLTLVALAKKGLIISLFLIGNAMNLRQIKEAGPRAFLLGGSLWLLVSLGSWWVITSF